MTPERALEIVKWGLYAPGMKNNHPSERTRREALRVLSRHPELWNQLPWKDES